MDPCLEYGLRLVYVGEPKATPSPTTPTSKDGPCFVIIDLPSIEDQRRLD